jgi:predicted nucleotidyltransferase
VQLSGAQTALLEAATRVGEQDERIRAVVARGSLARGQAHARSDVDLIVVAERGRLGDLWNDLDALLAELGEAYGWFRESPRSVVALFPGPLKVDVSFWEAELPADPRLGRAVLALVDKDGAVTTLRQRLADLPEPTFGGDDLRELDMRAWDAVLRVAGRLDRGELWLGYVWTVGLLFEQIVVEAWNAVADTPGAGCRALAERLDGAEADALGRALPRAVARDELRRSLDDLIASYLRARDLLAARVGAPPDALMRDVLGRIR